MMTWLEKFKKAMAKVIEKTDLNKYRITLTDTYADATPVVKMQGQNIAANENITVLSAASKAGKTSLLQVWIAGLLSSNVTPYSFDSFEFISNDKGKAMVHFDTEQSPNHQQKFIKNVCKRSGLDVMPDFFLSYNIRDIPFEEYIGIVSGICEESASTFNGIHAIFIDGGADFIKSVNDDIASKIVIQFFTKLSVKYNCPVFIVVHTNPAVSGVTKERGHLGSELQRKCYAVVNVVKEDSISTASTKIMRDGETGIGVSFRWSNKEGMHLECEGGIVSKNKSIEECKRCINELESLLFKELKGNIMERLVLKKTAAEGRIEKWIEFNFIYKGADSRYRLINKSTSNEDSI